MVNDGIHDSGVIERTVVLRLERHLPSRLRTKSALACPSSCGNRRPASQARRVPVGMIELGDAVAFNFGSVVRTRPMPIVGGGIVRSSRPRSPARATCGATHYAKCPQAGHSKPVAAHAPAPTPALACEAAGAMASESVTRAPACFAAHTALATHALSMFTLM
jgi:hypothetical protein